MSNITWEEQAGAPEFMLWGMIGILVATWALALIMALWQARR